MRTVWGSGLTQTSVALNSLLLVDLVIKHPLHHPLAVVFKGDNPKAHQKDQRNSDQNRCAQLADLQIAK